MDNKKRQRNLNITLIGLATASVGMFAYSNVYMPNFAEEETVNVYVATQDIPANVDLEEEMFKSIKINEDSYIEGSITNLNQIEGKQLTGRLEAGELLSTARMTSDVHSDGPLIAELLIPTSIPLQHNDTIRVYAQYESGGKVTVEELFHEKKVISKEKIAGDKTLGEKVEEATAAATQPASDGSVVYVRLTDKEAMDYQEAVNTGTLYAVKVQDVEEKNSLSSGVQVSERDAKSSEDEEQSEGTVALYEVKDGDSLTSIAKDFMTTEDKIVALNDGETNFKVGDKIQVPGN